MSDSPKHGSVATESAGTSPSEADTADAHTPGRRVVFAIYAASITTAGVFGFILGFVLDRQNGPSIGSFGPVTFPLTPLNLAVFGMVMIGLLLTVGLLLVREAARRES